mmetsp:Transcript_62542/g.152265  ORF Transcript_62542/g.152265 Transcript_62542/m.152265 type:complete len:365 (+) Transcript_62542:191-1285(+)
MIMTTTTHKRSQRRSTLCHFLTLTQSSVPLLSLVTAMIAVAITTTTTTTTVNAFSTIPAGRLHQLRTTPSIPKMDDILSKGGNKDNEMSSSINVEESTTTTITTTAAAPWRIVLDIGREPLANMPFEWARSGCRMPLVVPCDFTTNTSSNNKDGEEKASLVVPHKDTVSFTDAGGAVVKPVEGGPWEFIYDGGNKSNKQPTGLTFSLSFPETLQRRDVTIEKGSTLELTARVYTKAEFDALNDAYYQAREDAWEMGGKLNAAARRQGAAKKWNEEKGQWEKRYDDENPLKMIRNQVKYWSAKAKQDAAQRQRPDANEISECGPFPGLEDGLYVAKNGIVRLSKNGPVMGTWSTEPIIDRSIRQS